MGFVSLFYNEVHVTVSPTSFIFSCRKLTKELPTYIIISDDEQKVVLAVGENYRGMARFKKVDFLFAYSDDQEMKFKCIQSFVRFGFLAVLKGIFMARPTVLVENANSLRVALGEDYEVVLDSAIRHSGAKEVIFKKPN